MFNTIRYLLLPVLNASGPVFIWLAAALLIPFTLSVSKQDGAADSFLTCFLITLATGVVLMLLTRRWRRELTSRHGFLLVTLIWTSVPLFGTIPFIIERPEMSFAQLYFEMMSCLTTTGATVFTGLDKLPVSLNGWRCFLSWIGGMGLIVLSVAILPLLGVGGSQIIKAETTGPLKEHRLTPRIADTAKALYIIYLGVSVACAISYHLAGMEWEDAIMHMMTTVSLSGIATHDASFAYFNSPAVDAVAIVFMLIFLALTAWVVYCGVEKGIEKYSRYIMPGLLLLIIGIAIFSLTLSYTDESGMTRTGIEGLLVYIKPDFTGLTVQRFLNIALDAMSQLFFSLSVSMGIMITYGSYVKDDVDLNKANNQIEIFDTGVAFLAGLMIIPAVYVFLGTDGMASGPSLTFISLPKVFAAMGGVGRVIGAVFFLALGFAALTSCVSVMETLVANCMEIFHKSRKEMCAAVGIYSLVTAVLICMGYNVLYFELPLPNGSTAQLLDVMDYISNSFLMPFISLLTSILVGWVVGPKWIIAEVEKNGEHFGRAKLYSVMMKYVVPVVMLILFLTSTGLGSLIFGGR